MGLILSSSSNSKTVNGAVQTMYVQSVAVASCLSSFSCAENQRLSSIEHQYMLKQKWMVTRTLMDKF